MATAVTVPGQESDLVYHSFPIEKTETDPATGTLYVYGKATSPDVDSDEQIVDPDWSAKAMETWFQTGPNVRVMHNPSAMPAGSGVKVEINRDGDGGHWVKAAVDEPTAKLMVQRKHLRAFSVGIARPLIVQDVTGKARGGIIKGGELAEISLVDRPANRSCYVEIAKSAGDGSCEFTGKVFGGPDFLAKGTVSVELPKDVSVSFSPADLQKLLEHRRVAEEREIASKGDLSAADRAKLKDSDFAYVDSQGDRHLPVHDEGHVRSALGRFGQQQFEDDAAKKKAAGKIIARAKEMGIGVDEHSDVAQAAKAAGGETVKAAGKKPCGLCEGKGKIREGNMDCPRCHGDGEIDEGEPDEHGESQDKDAAPNAVKVGPHGYEHGWIYVGVGEHDDIRDKADKVSDNAFKRGDSTREAVDGHREAARLHRQAARASGTQQGHDYHESMAKLHSKVASGRMESRDAEDKADTLRRGKAVVADLAKAGSRSCTECGKSHDADSPAKFCAECGTKLPAVEKETAPDLAKAGNDDGDDPGGTADDDGNDDDADGDDEDDDEDEDDEDEDARAGKAAKPTPGDGVTGEHVEPVPEHREPDGPAIESLEHDAHMPTVPDDTAKAASLRFKALGVPHSLGVLHDLTCAAYHPAAVAKAHPGATLADIDANEWMGKALDAAASAPFPEAAKAQMMWQHALTLKGADPVTVAEVSEALHKAFSDANPGPGTFPTPAELSPQQFRRPYITEGHAAPSPGQDAPNSAQIPASGGITAGQFDRGYITDGHAADSPSNKADGGDPPKPGSSNSRTFYRNTVRDGTRAAMQAMHDHIAQTFPDLCAMKDDPNADPAPQPNPLPRPVGSSKSAAAPAPAPAAVRQPEARKAAGAVSPDVIKAAVAEATAELSAQLAESNGLLSQAMELLKAQGGALEKHGQVLDAIASQPDPVAPYRGAVLTQQQNKSVMAPAGPSTMAGAAEQAQSYVYAELYNEWRNSPDPAARLAAERAMEKMRGLPYAS